MGTVHRIMLSHRGFSRSLGNMIEVLKGEAKALLDSNWIDVEEREPGVFVLVGENLTSGSNSTFDRTELGFAQWDDEVEDLDNGRSEESHCLGISTALRWQEVRFAPREYCAPSLERLTEAFGHVALCAWCPGDI